MHNIIFYQILMILTFFKNFLGSTLISLLLDLNDIGFLIFVGPLNLTHCLIVNFQNKCQNYDQNHYSDFHYLCDLLL